QAVAVEQLTICAGEFAALTVIPVTSSAGSSAAIASRSLRIPDLPKGVESGYARWLRLEAFEDQRMQATVARHGLAAGIGTPAGESGRSTAGFLHGDQCRG